MQFFEDFKDLADLAQVQALLPAELGDSLTYENPVCGDKIWVTAQLSEGKVKSLNYAAKGCWPVLGCLELLRQRTLQRSPIQVLAYSLEEFLAEVTGVPASKRHAFSLAHRGVTGAVISACTVYEQKQSVGLTAKERLQ